MVLLDKELRYSPQKRNTMKTKSMILAPVFLLCASLFFQVESVSAQNITKKGLVGIWQLCDAEGNVLTSGQFSEHKVITPTQFMVVAVDEAKDNIVIIYSGSYTLKRDWYEETIEKCTPGLEKDLKKTNSFKIETLNSDLIHIIGQNNKFDQYWVRVPSLSE